MHFRQINTSILLILSCFFGSIVYAVDPTFGKWEIIEDCRLVDSGINDGDSFKVRYKNKNGKKEVSVFRLYFVDAPETTDTYKNRLSDQAWDFDISESQVIEAGKSARSFTKRFLRGKFTVITHWEPVGREKKSWENVRGKRPREDDREKTPRYFAIVQKKGCFLSAELVENGYARIYGDGYGYKISNVWPVVGLNSISYLKVLKNRERVAQKQLKGIWKLSQKQLKETWKLSKRKIIKTSGKVELLLNSPIGAELKKSTQSVIGKALINLIDSTEKTLDMAIYGFRDQPDIFDALVRAKERGVDIRLVTDRKIDGTNYYSSTEKFEKLVENIRTDQKTDLEKAKRSRLEAFWPSPDGFEGPPQPLGYSIGDDKAIIAVHASRDLFEFQGDLMHNKFVISDQQRVWTGSCNLSDSGTGGYNANIACIIDSNEVANHFTEEFELMYKLELFHRQKNQNRHKLFHRQKNQNKHKLFHRQKNQNNRHYWYKDLINWCKNLVILDRKKLYLGFCPQDDVVQSSLIPAIQEAKTSIDVAIFFLTHKYITAELIKAHLRGVKVRIIIDGTSASNGYTKHKILREAGIPVKVENWGGKMHMKAACIDGQKLVLGSMNWTSAGELENDENYLLLECRIDSQKFTRFFDTLWKSIPDRCLVDDPDPESLASPGSTSDGADNDFDRLVDSEDPGATEFLYNSKPTPPHGIAIISRGVGTIDGKEFPLIIGLSEQIESNRNCSWNYYVLPDDPDYSALKEKAKAFFPSIWEAKEAGYELNWTFFNTSNSRSKKHIFRRIRNGKTIRW